MRAICSPRQQALVAHGIVKPFYHTGLDDFGQGSSENGCFYNFENLAYSISRTTCHSARQGSTFTWNGCDSMYVSWGVKKGTDTKHFARPLPQIYHDSATLSPWGTDATAFQALSLFSATQMGAGKIYFAGSLTQRARCGDACGQGNNYPWKGYALLYRALATNPTTSMRLRWSNDIQIQRP
jgi:hypothetical protein